MSAQFVCLCSRRHTWQWHGFHCVLRLPQQPAECPLPVPAGAYYYGNTAGLYQKHTHPGGPYTFRFVKIHTLFDCSRPSWNRTPALYVHLHSQHEYTFLDMCRSVFINTACRVHSCVIASNLFLLISSFFFFCYDRFILSNVCSAFGLLLHQCQSNSPFLTDRPHSCEKGEVWGATLSPELRTRLGAAARRGSAPVIDTQRANHIAQLHALIQSQRSISPTLTVTENQSELSPSGLYSEAKDGFPSQRAPPLLQVSPVSSPSEYRRLSDTSIRPSSEATSENLTLPASSGRRHSDLSSLLSLTCHQNHHFAMHRNVCQACLSLLLVRSREGSNRGPSAVTPAHLCPCDFRHHPSSGGTMTTPAYGRLKGSSDCSDFSLLQQSLFNIISRKAAPCHTTPTQASPLHSSAAHRPACSDGDGSLKSHPLSGSLVGDQEPLRDCEDRFCAGEQQVTRAVGVVGHNSRQVALVSHEGANTCLTDFSLPVGDTTVFSFCMEPVWSHVYCLSLAACTGLQSVLLKIISLLLSTDNGVVPNRPHFPAD